MEGSKIGMLVIVAAAIIVGAVLLTALADQSAVATTTTYISNTSVTSGLTGNSSVTLPGQNFQGTVILINSTGTTVSSQFTVTATGGVISMKILDTGVAARNNGTTIRASYTQEPVGYADATTRSIIPIIVIFFAIAILAISLWPVVRDMTGMGAI